MFNSFVIGGIFDEMQSPKFCVSGLKATEIPPRDAQSLGLFCVYRQSAVTPANEPAWAALKKHRQAFTPFIASQPFCQGLHKFIGTW